MSSLKGTRKAAHHSEPSGPWGAGCSSFLHEDFKIDTLTANFYFLPSLPSPSSLPSPPSPSSLPLLPAPDPSLGVGRSLTKVLGELAFSFPSVHVSKLASHGQLQFCLEGHLESLSNIYHNTLFMNRWALHTAPLLHSQSALASEVESCVMINESIEMQSDT